MTNSILIICKPHLRFFRLIRENVLHWIQWDLETLGCPYHVLFHSAFWHLAAAETWNVETLRSETWCPKRKPRNVTPYRSENDIWGVPTRGNVGAFELGPFEPPPPPKNWAPPPKRGHFRGFVNRNPLWNVDLGQRWARLLHVSCFFFCWALF